MRIVAGTLGGRVLRAPRGATTRPTSEKVREAIFNVLGPPPDGLTVLDLFAGSGALGLEALSRGATHATFVERDRGALGVLRGNLAALELGDRATVVTLDVARFLATATATAAADAPPWGWIFLDPPYAAGLYEATLAALPRGRLTAASAVVVEHAHRLPPPDRAGSLIRTDLRRYGDTAVSRYRLAEDS